MHTFSFDSDSLASENKLGKGWFPMGWKPLIFPAGPRNASYIVLFQGLFVFWLSWGQEQRHLPVSLGFGFRLLWCKLRLIFCHSAFAVFDGISSGFSTGSQEPADFHSEPECQCLSKLGEELLPDLWDSALPVLWTLISWECRKDQILLR